MRAAADGCARTLVTLDLSGNARLDGDACIRALAAGPCVALRTLRLSGTRLTDAGIQAAVGAKGLPALVTLEVEGCAGVSDAALAA